MTPRDVLDQDVLLVVRRARRALSATDVSTRLDISVMSASCSLRRLRERGQVWSSVEVVDRPGRINTPVEFFSKPAPARSIWPAWLAPRALPEYAARRMVVRGVW